MRFRNLARCRFTISWARGPWIFESDEEMPQAVLDNRHYSRDLIIILYYSSSQALV